MVINRTGKRIRKREPLNSFLFVPPTQSLRDMLLLLSSSLGTIYQISITELDMCKYEQKDFEDIEHTYPITDVNSAAHSFYQHSYTFKNAYTERLNFYLTHNFSKTTKAT